MANKYKKGEVLVNYNNNTKIVVLDPKTNYGLVLNDGYAEDFYFDDVQKTKQAPYTVVSEERTDIYGDPDYRFYMLKRGRKTYISAGCRFFTSVKDAKVHWSKPAKYPGRILFESQDNYIAAREFKNRQSLKIIDRLSAKLKKLGV